RFDQQDLALVGGVPLAHGALHFRVTGVADQHHAAAGAAQARHFHMHLGDQRTGSVEHLQPALVCLFAHGLGHAVGAEDHRGAVGHFVQFFHEHGAVVAEFVDYVAVVHHLVTHVDGRAIGFERTLDDGDGAVYAGAETTRIGEQNVHGCSG